MTLTDAQRTLLGIITSVEAGVTTPEAATEELARLKSEAPENFRADYTLEDFQKIRDANASTYTPSYEFEESFETSESY